MTLALVACGALAIATLGVGIASQRGRLPRNYFAGIRTTKLLQDDRSWQTGHRAAAPAMLTLGVLGLLAMLLIVLAPATMVDPIVYGYIVVILLGLAYAAWIAGRAVDRLGPED